jgi:hypothetical protein
MKNIYFFSIFFLISFWGINISAQTFDPERGATNVTNSPIITITFTSGSTVDFGSGNSIVVGKSWDAGDYIELKTGPRPSRDSRLSIINDSIVQIDLSGDELDYSTEYFVSSMDHNVIVVDGTGWDNLYDDSYYRFTTEAAPPPPTVVKYIPAVGDTNVRLNDTLKLIFNEAVTIGSAGKYLKIKKCSDSINLISIENIDTEIFNDTILKITHPVFVQDTSYFILIDTGFVKSVNTNTDFNGITDASEWTFKAIKVRNWIGNYGTGWTDSDNWDSNGSFVDGAVLNILNTATYFPVITSGSNIEIADLIIDDGAGISINSGATVTVDSIIELRSTVNANAYLLCNGTLNYTPANMKIYQDIQVNQRWYYISSPVKNATGCSISCDGEIWYWNNALGKWEMADLTDTLNTGQGYTLWSNNDLVFTGEINTGDITVNLDYGKSVGWNLIGNPYTNSINWDNVQLSSDSIFDGFWLYKNLNSVYGSYNGNTHIGTNLDLDSIIPSNHNFWVKLDTTVSETITFTSACKTTATGSYLKSAPAESEFPIFKFAASNGANRDEIIISFANPEEMPLRKMNMTKLFTSNTNYIQPYFTSGSEKLCMKGLPEFTSEITVPFALKIDTAINSTSFAIQKILIDNFPDDIVILLHDKKTEQFTDLVAENSYSFTESNKGDITDRFELIFKGDLATDIKEIKEPNKDAENGVYLVSGNKQFTIYNTESSDVKVYNLSGQVIKDMKDISSGKVIEVPVRGMYVVQITQDGKTISKKVFVK